MGMQSWKCKGCGHELKMGEHVRINGSVAEYSGYASEHTESSDASAWHVQCYNKASNRKKLDDSPSAHAPNQGFGPITLEFQQGFDPKLPITDYTVRFDCTHVVGDTPETMKTIEMNMYLTEDNILENENEFKEKHDAMSEEQWERQNDLEHKGEFSTEGWTDEQYAKHDLKLRNERINKLGDLPSRCAKKFSSLSEAIFKAESWYKARGLPSEEWFLYIDAKQGNLSGNVYEYMNHREWNKDTIEPRVIYQIGKTANQLSGIEEPPEPMDQEYAVHHWYGGEFIGNHTLESVFDLDYKQIQFNKDTKVCYVSNSGFRQK